MKINIILHYNVIIALELFCRSNIDRVKRRRGNRVSHISSENSNEP